MNITASKTATLQGLVRQVQEATTIVAEANAKYQSFANKAAMYQDLFNQCSAELAMTESHWQLFLTLRSSLVSLKGTAVASNEVAAVSYARVKKMITHWEGVMSETLEAADAINLAGDLIAKRKAANPLISNDLVSDAKTAAANAISTVKSVITALTAVLNALTSSSKANNSTALTELYVGLAMAVLLKPDPGNTQPKASQPMISGPAIAATPPLEESMQASLTRVRQKLAEVRTASDQAAKEAAAAKEEADAANALLATSQVALGAAQQAVAA